MSKKRLDRLFKPGPRSGASLSGWPQARTGIFPRSCQSPEKEGADRPGYDRLRTPWERQDRPAPLPAKRDTQKRRVEAGYTMDDTDFAGNIQKYLLIWLSVIMQAFGTRSVLPSPGPDERQTSVTCSEERCQSKPLILIIDEAHCLDPEMAGELLNDSQTIRIDASPVPAGTGRHAGSPGNAPKVRGRILGAQQTMSIRAIVA